MNLSDPRSVCKHGVHLSSRCGFCFYEMGGKCMHEHFVYAPETRSRRCTECDYTEPYPTYLEGIDVESPTEPPKEDKVSHPSHYTSHPSGIECIQITEHMGFCLGNAIKYIWRAGLKQGNDPANDLRKAIWYIEREIKRLTK